MNETAVKVTKFVVKFALMEAGCIGTYLLLDNLDDKKGNKVEKISKYLAKVGLSAYAGYITEQMLSYSAEGWCLIGKALVDIIE